MLAQVPDDELGTVTMPNIVPKLSATPGTIRHSGRRVGQDTRRVLRELAGLSAEEIAQLEAAHVIACDDAGDTAPGTAASISSWEAKA
jgi:crotonobetainyl-CoA:carnitine CoA-transferase CaiB-like acyl-CoA transferase